MQWPWVSRHHLVTEKAKTEYALGVASLAQERLQALQRQYDKLVDELLRIRRKDSGMPESHARERTPHDDMPPSVVAYIQGWDSEAMRQSIEDDVWRSREYGTPWSEIMEILEADALDL